MEKSLSSIKNDLDRAVEKWNLLRHPFYQAWEAGSLPVEALAVYAKEYGSFISCLPKGWQSLGVDDYADEEVEHIGLWMKFAESVNSEISEPTVEEVKALLEISGDLFTERTKTIGAMYAFECQQPQTAKSKLNGLRENYRLERSLCEPYFIAHSENDHETGLLLSMTEDLSEEESTKCIESCERMAEALWDSLTGIHRVAMPDC